ncbi:MAG: S8 family serine peptidase [Bacillota bacterium]
MMRKGQLLAAATAASILMGAFGVQAYSATRDQANQNLPVRLKQGHIYMTRQAKAAVTSGESPTGRALYIVQFTGPVKDAYKSALTRLGVELGDYLPENAFLVRMDGGQRTRVAGLGFVKGVARYEAVHKLDPGLGWLGPVKQVQVTTFGPSSKGSIAALTALGVQPEHIGVGTFTARLDQAKLQQLAQSPDVVYVEPAPRYALFNDKAGEIMGLSPVWKSGFDGKGQIVAVTDTGLDTGKNDSSMHPDLQGQIKALYALGKPGDASDTMAHGTHVAGSVLGTGKASGGLHKGMAPAASLVFQSVEDSQGGLGGIPEDLTSLFRQAYEAGARIHTNSWGIPATSGGTVYNAQSSQVDRFMWENPEYTILFAAGNDGDHDRNNQINYGTVSAPGTAKNAITVGASQNSRPDRKMATDPSDMASFSSRGPTQDNRVKPDIVAPGTWIASTRASQASDRDFWAPHESNSRYGYMGGTSMSTPLTAGAAATLRQFYVEKLGVTPRASLLKASLINGAVSMKQGLTWKDNGWGRVDLNNALYTRPFQFVNEEKALKTGESAAYTYEVKEGQPLKFTLVWTDYPANPSAEKTLVNDLDLTVTGPDGKRLAGNHMIGQTPDRSNNVENVVVAAPASGRYTVTVTGHNIPQGPQRFALVISGNLGSGGSQPTPPPQDPQPKPPADSEKPVVKVTSPTAGATLSGPVSITADATDNTGIAKVLFYVDGVEVGSAATAPYSITWDSTRVKDGDHTIVANAYDAAGNVGISSGVAVKVSNSAVSAGQSLQFTGKTAAHATTRRFYLDVQGPGRVSAQLALSGQANVTLTAFDPGGRQVATGSGGLSFDAATAGTYSITLLSSGGYADYSLKVTYPPIAGTRFINRAGQLSTAGQRFMVVPVPVTRQGAVNALVTAKQARADLDLYLLDGWGRVMAMATSPNLNPEAISAFLSPGTYYLYVVVDSGATDLQLTVLHR